MQLPIGTKVSETSGTIVSVYDRRSVKGPSGSVQNGVLKDQDGAEIEIAVWGHQDLLPLKGKEVVITDNQGGMSTKEDTYKGKSKRVLSLNRSSVFQVLDSGGARSVPTPSGSGGASSAPKPSHPVVSGQTIGMAINNAALDFREAGERATEQQIFERASLYVRVSLRMDRGELHAGDSKPENPF